MIVVVYELHSIGTVMSSTTVLLITKSPSAMFIKSLCLVKWLWKVHAAKEQRIS